MTIKTRLTRLEGTLEARTPERGAILDLAGDTMPAELAARYDALLATGCDARTIEGLQALYDRVTNRLEAAGVQL